MTATTVRTAPRQLLRLRADAELVLDDDGAASLRAGFRIAGLGRLPGASLAVVQALADRPASEGELMQVAGGPAAGAQLLRATMLVQRLRRTGWLTERTMIDGEPLFEVRPHVAGKVRPEVPVPTAATLSRFAHLRRIDDALVVDAPQATAMIAVLDRRVTAALHDLTASAGGAGTDGTNTPGTGGSESALAAPVLQALLRELAGAGLLTGTQDGQDPELAEPRWRQWSFHDLLFHNRSRVGRTSDGYGGTYANASVLAPLPATRAPVGPVRALPEVDLEQGAGAVPFADVVEQRRSIRVHDDARPITVDQLAELLFRTLRERRVLHGTDGEDASDRPYPCGGALYELDVYAVVRSCTDLPAGIHRYLPDRHALEFVTDYDDGVESFLRLTGQTAQFTTAPQIALVITGRFGRVMRKYESMPYALMLKHVGVVYHHLYLTATAMGLAPCGLGGGDSDRFAALTATDPLIEASLGEFLIGSAPPQSEPGSRSPSAAQS